MKKGGVAAFTLVELLVVVSIVSLLASLLLPALGKAKDTAKAIQCKSNLKQLGAGLFSYFTDYQEWIPFGYDTNSSLYAGYATLSTFAWYCQVAEYVNCRAAGYNAIVPRDVATWTAAAFQSPVVYACPKVGRSYPCGFPIDFAPPTPIAKFAPLGRDGVCRGKLSMLKLPANRAFLLDYSDSAYAQFFNVGLSSSYAPRHAGGLNLLFFDGHVGWDKYAYLFNKGALTSSYYADKQDAFFAYY